MKLSWETGIKEVGFEVFPERCNRGAISYLEGEGVNIYKQRLKNNLEQVFSILKFEMAENKLYKLRTPP